MRCSASLLNPTLGKDLLPPLLVTFGLSVIIQNALLAVLHRRQPPARGRADRDGELPVAARAAASASCRC